METISIVFSRSSSSTALFSRLIMATEKTPYSHVALKMTDNETGQVVYYQSSHTMVNEMSEEEFLRQETVIYSFDFQVDSQLKKNMKEFAIAQLGKPYGVRSVLGLALVQIGKWIGIKISNPFRDAGQTYVCDQFVAAIANLSKEITIDDETLNNLAPVDLYPMVQTWPKTLSVDS